ncbi:hypothetical protein QYM36_013980 [Artemia franciscana]|uniref:Uncharacterized protein n=1 Tax=Artemia franciscana TaxID=6661 RepID=A0AA88HFY8_ARTSF|nr:hypothetical protein QYM36_013980 [Artemia franciscana]
MEPGLIMLDRLQHNPHSQELSHYCLTRALLAAGFPLWPGTHHFKQPRDPCFRSDHDVDARLSADAYSTWATMSEVPHPQTIHWSRLSHELQKCATTSSRLKYLVIEVIYQRFQISLETPFLMQLSWSILIVT